MLLRMAMYVEMNDNHLISCYYMVTSTVRKSHQNTTRSIKWLYNGIITCYMVINVFMQNKNIVYSLAILRQFMDLFVAQCHQNKQT